MPDIRDSVGEGATNAGHDVALIQAMLRVVKDAKGVAYFANVYTGTYDPATKNAIIAFQTDQKLIPAADTDAAAAAKLDKSGLIAKNSATLKALSNALTGDYKDMTVIQGTKTVYLAMAEATAKANAKTIQNKADLDQNFRGGVANLVTEMYAQHKIVLSIPGDGWNRDFAAQAIPAATNKGVGPGESNHQYGKAVDIGFNGLRWVGGDGQIHQENSWLDTTNMPIDKQQAFWQARNDIATVKLGLFNINGEDIHLQAYDEKKVAVSYGRSLVGLLQSTGVKGTSVNGMKWAVNEINGKNNNQYRSDFGLGGVGTYKVGKAREIWGGNATVNKADLVAALNAKLAADKTFSVEKFFGVAAQPAQPAKPGQNPPAVLVLKENDIKADYINTMKTRLKADFQAADNNRNNWKPLP